MIQLHFMPPLVVLSQQFCPWTGLCAHVACTRHVAAPEYTPTMTRSVRPSTCGPLRRQVPSPLSPPTCPYVLGLQALEGMTSVACVGDGCLWPLLLLLQARNEGTNLPNHYYYISSSSHSTNLVKQVQPVNLVDFIGVKGQNTTFELYRFVLFVASCI